MSQQIGKRAIVVGGSLAGMLSARVLADYFEEVIVFDRDDIPESPIDRSMTPQSHHVHILLKGGELAINHFFPGFETEMDDLGSVKIEMSREMNTASPMGKVPKWDSGIVLQSQSRALLEHHLRQRTKNYSDNIQFLFGKTVRQLTYNATENCVTGAIVETSDKTSTEYKADFTVDASGRGGGGLRWLTALGLPVPNVDEVKVNFGYSSCKIKLRDQSQRDWNGVACGGLPPKDGRGGLMLPIEDGLHICSIGGRFRDYPPTEESEFRAYIKNLAVDVMHKAIDDAEIVSPIVKMRYKANRFRHYESLESLPSGFIPLGDAYCSVNPTYGQGMSSTSLQAKALESALASLNNRQGIADIPAVYFPKAKEIVTQIWRNANFSDFAFPETEGDRSDYGEEERDYNMALQIVSFTDEALRLKLVKVGQYMEKPEILETPEIRQKVAAQLSRAEGEIANLESSRVDVPLEVLNTYVGLYEFDSALLKTLQVKLQRNDLEIVGIDANGTALFTDKLVTLGPNKFAVDNKMVSVRFIIENNEVVGMESNQNQRISVSRRAK